MARYLTQQGFQAFALVGGYIAWYKAGFPIERKQATAAVSLKTICPDCGLPTDTHVSPEEE